LHETLVPFIMRKKVFNEENMATLTLGDYTIIKKLGEGGFGEVYLAEHNFLKKSFAIKVLNEQLSHDPQFIESFQKDISLIATLDHPSIVKVHNISCADGKYFIVMDAILSPTKEASNLQTYLEHRGSILPESTVETIAKQIASALDHAHEKQIGSEKVGHRGIKLTNVLVDESEGKQRFLLTDFALPRIVGEGETLRKSYEMALKNSDPNALRKSIETFSFLSPEQKFRNHVDFRSDQYSYGVLIYYLITRRFPEGFFEMPSKVAPEYNLNWDLFISKCLHQNPKKRPEQLSKALETLLMTTPDAALSIDVLSWEEVEKKVESAMQMSFEFSYDEVKKAGKSTTSEITPSAEDKTPSVEEHDSGELKPVISPQEIKRPEYEQDPGAIFQKELNVSHYQPKKIEIEEVEPILTKMVVIPGGSFYRGSNDGARDEMPRHKISLSSFALDIHPVTNEQYVRFLQSMGGEKDVNNNDIIRLRDARIKRSGGKLMIESGYAKHPVVGVTWYGAAAYAKWIGKRLPTEAEWEVACMGTLDSPFYPSGENIDHSQANFFSSDTTGVMSYPPNSAGLYDIVGNVYEWCEDWYAYNYYDTSLQEPESPRGPQQGVYRVLRGGCWKSLKEDLRCSHRHRNNPGAFNSTYGFRCATDVS